MSTWADYWASLAQSQTDNNAGAASASPPSNVGTTSQYWNPFSQQWQGTDPSKSPTPAGYAGYTPGAFVPTYLGGNSVTGPDPNNPSQNLNPFYYATQDTANYMAQLLGGTATQLGSNTTGGGYQSGLQAQGSPFNFPGAWMVQMPDGTMMNAGLASQDFAEARDPNAINLGLARMANGGSMGANDPLLSPTAATSSYLGNGQFNVNYNPTPRAPGVAPQIAAQAGGIPGYANFTSGAANPWTLYNPQGQMYGPGGGLNTAGNGGNPFTPIFPSMGATPNPYSIGSGPGGSAIPYTPPTAPGDTSNPFSTGAINPSSGLSQVLSQGSGSSSSADDWLSGQAQGSTNALQALAGGTNPLQQRLAQGNFPGSSQLSQFANGSNPLQQQLAQGNFSGASGLNSFANGSNPLLQQLAQGQSPNQDALQAIIAGQGNPINQTPAWQAMVDAQKHNIDEGQASLNEQFNVGGGRFSTAFGTASADYRDQAVKDQNSLLAQLTAQSGENAQSRLLSAGGTLAGIGAQGLSTAAGLGQSAASTLGGYGFSGLNSAAGLGQSSANSLGGYGMSGLNSAAGLGAQAAGQLGQIGYGGASQLSAQDFQSMAQQYGVSADMAKYMAGGADTAASQLAGLGAQGSQSLYGGAIAGANNLFNAENQAATSMFGAQNSLLPSFMNYGLQTQQQGLGAASDLSNLWNANLQTGSQLGQQQYSIGQNEINNAYQQWLYQQPTNNPLLSMMFSGATGYPQMYNPSYQPGVLGSILGAVGSVAGAAGAAGGITGLFK